MAIKCLGQHLVMDCVGSLPTTKTGNQFLFAMCGGVFLKQLRLY